MAKILYIEDDVSLAESVKNWLQLKSHTVDIVHSSEDAHQLMANFHYDIILLEWILPGKSGLDFCIEYRRDGGNASIVFLTELNDIVSLETAFEMGANEYLSKPFSTRVLSARLDAILRRANRSYQPDLSVGDARLNTKMHTLHIGKIDLHLMPKESRLLEFLFRNVNSGFSSRQLLVAVWSPKSRADEAIVRTYIRQVRRKLQPLGRQNLIETLTGVGYMVRSTE